DLLAPNRRPPRCLMGGQRPGGSPAEGQVVGTVDCPRRETRDGRGVGVRPYPQGDRALGSLPGGRYYRPVPPHGSERVRFPTPARLQRVGKPLPAFRIPSTKSSVDITWQVV